MTRIKLCGLTRPCDIEAANALLPDYIGLVFAPRSRRRVTPEQAAALKSRLDPRVQAVGVFVNEAPETVAALCHSGVIDLVQLHGSEDEAYLRRLRALVHQPIIQAFTVCSARDVLEAQHSTADLILLDSGAGSGSAFDWDLLQEVRRPYFLAGGLTEDSAAAAVHVLHPYGVDVSSGIEKDGRKDSSRMAAFVAAVRKEDAL